MWAHKEHIVQQFLRICTTDTTDEMTKGSAAWQTGLCYATGFGASIDWKEADKYFLQATRLGCSVAQNFQKMLYHQGAEHTGELYTVVVCEMLSLKAVPSAEAHWLNSAENWDQENHSINGQHSGNTSTASIKFLPDYVEETAASRLEAAISRGDCDDIFSLHQTIPIEKIPCVEPPLIQALRTGNRDVVYTLLCCAVSPETRDMSGRNAFHWLFMLDEDAHNFAKKCPTIRQSSSSLCVIAERPIAVHPQWPLQLEGTPLSHAIAAGSRNTVSALLSLGAHPLEEFSLSGSPEPWTPIHVAIRYHRSDILEVLLDVTNGTWDSSSYLPPLGVALSGSSVLERIAIYGSNRKKHLNNTIALLGPPKCLEDVSIGGVTALMRSLQSNDLEVTSALLQSNPVTSTIQSILPSEAKDPVYHYPIHLAAQLASREDDNKAVEVLELITKFDTYALSRLDSNKRSPLHLAATGQYSHAVTFLMKHEPSLLHAVDCFGAQPLHYCESALVADHLINLGADVDALDNLGRSALCYAVEKELSAVVRVLCKHKAATNVGVRAHHNPLHIAIKNGTHEIATTLIAFGALVNKPDPMGNTPLHIAARSSPSHILELLLENGANALVLNDRDQSALHTAAQYDNYAAIDTLTHHKPQLILHVVIQPNSSELSIPRHISQSPLFFCMKGSNTRAIDVMLSRLRKQDAESLDFTGRNTLHYAAEAGNQRFVEGLTRKGVDLNTRTKTGDTALMLAARSNLSRIERPKLCHLLIEKGASLTAENNVGEMLWDIAVESILVGPQDDLRSVAELLLLHSDEACRMITRRKQNTHDPIGRCAREPCGRNLLQFAFTRPDYKLLKALKAKIPAAVFEEEENKVLSAKTLEEEAAKARAEVEISRENRQRVLSDIRFRRPSISDLSQQNGIRLLSNMELVHWNNRSNRVSWSLKQLARS